MAGTIRNERKEELIKLKKQLDILSDSIQDIIDGKTSMKEFADTNLITSQVMNTYIHNGLYPLLRGVRVLNDREIQNLLLDSMSPSERLIRVMLDVNEVVILDIEDDEKFMEILKEYLSDNELNIINYRYGFTEGRPMTLEKTANLFGISRIRVGQIEASALRKLRKTKCIKKLLPNYDLKIKELLDIESVSRLNDELDALVEASKETNDHNPLFSIEIKEMNLTTRAYNALYRNGIRTVGDLTKLSIEDIMRLRNCGKVSAMEIVNALENKYGIKMQGDYVIY